MRTSHPSFWKTMLVICWLLSLAAVGPRAGSPTAVEAAPSLSQDLVPSAPPVYPTTSVGTQARAVAREGVTAEVAELTFKRLGASDFVLRPHYSQHGMSFALPYHWRIAPGSSFLEVHYDLVSDEQAVMGFPETQPGVVEIYLDGGLVGSFIPRGGPGQTVRLALPASAFGDPAENQHTLVATYTSRVRCRIDDTDPARVIIRDNSSLYLEYQMAPMELNLALFPRPLYQELIGPEYAVIVIPDTYENTDLEAAASVAAAVGGSSFGGVEVSIRRVSEVTPEFLSDRDAILVGTPASHSMIADLYKKGGLPTALSKEGTISVRATGETASAEDGVIQEIHSLYSEDHVYLVVTGTSSGAVLRAARALSSLDPHFALRGNFTIISEVDDAEPPSLPGKVTLEQLGLREETLYGFGSGITRVRFFVGAGWRFEKDPRLTLAYRHSASLNTGVSNLTVLLNDNPVGSAPLIGGTDRTQELVLDLPMQDLKPGRNWLSFEALLELEDPCADPVTTAAWVRVLGTSTLEIPYQSTGKARLDVLANPIKPFASTFDLSDVWFVLPKEPDPRELDGLVEAAWMLGESTNGAGFAPRVSRGTSLRQVEGGYNVLAIGRPSENALIADVNDQLYQPFVEGTDTLKQQIGNVTYRLPKDFSVGLIQLVRAPWDSQRALTVVTGTTDEGVRWALDALKTGDPYTDLTVVGPNGVESLVGENMLRGTLGAIEAVADKGLTLETVEASPAPTMTPGRAPEPGTASATEYSAEGQRSSTMLVVSALLVGLGVLTIVVAGLVRRKAP